MAAFIPVAAMAQTAPAPIATPPAPSASTAEQTAPSASPADTAPAANTGDAAPLAKPDAAQGDIIVTGTRVVRDGYKSPTPVSVLGADTINKNAPANIADFVNELPSLSAGTTPRGQIGAVSGGTVGLNALNLRALGASRTLVLLDGKRVAASTLTGLVDVNTLPQALIKRVDIVTGGASADWGSDAVAGVVNFILDRDFTGLKGQVQGGVTTYGDDRSYNVSLTGGAKFADGRGHILLSGEITHNDGVQSIGNRTWYNGSKIFINPAYNAATNNAVPQYLVSPNAGFATATPGGIITNGPLKGTYFGPGGAPTQFNYGSIVSGNVMVGGDWQYADFARSGDLDPAISRQSLFGRLSFKVTDGVELFAEGSYNRAASKEAALAQFNFPSTITIQPDNAFIPASIASRITAPFVLGTFNQDLGPILATTRRQSYRGLIGAQGQFDAFGKVFHWDVYGQRTVNDIYTDVLTTVTARYAQAIDAVRNANGTIVCRSTLTDPTNGCVPYDVLGTGVASDAARNYVLAKSYGTTRLTQDVVAATLRGDPFSTWAGPVSVALGVEHRREAASGTNDPLRSAAYSAGLAPPYFVGNYLATFGSYHVNEAFLEAVVPLAKNLPFADSLDLNGAVRATDYSTSGYVTTWKLGLTYSPVKDLTFRVTRSRDIRAPNLAELFQTGLTTTTSLPDPGRNNTSSNVFQTTAGNPNLKPERADTFGVGVVFQPSFLPGFAASIDYYRIKIADAISTVNGASVVQQCYQGNTAFCSQITRATSGTQINGLYPITTVNVLPVNVANQLARGIDFEASYRHPLFEGNLTLRFLGTRFLENSSNDGITAPTDNVGQNGTNGSLRNPLPKFRYLATVSWDADPVSVSLSARGFSDGVLNTSYVQCTSGCPVSTVANPTVSNNFLPGATYFDASISAKVTRHVEAYLAVDNIANKDPAQMAFGPAFGSAPLSVNSILYDVLGRTFRVGVRFKM